MEISRLEETVKDLSTKLSMMALQDSNDKDDPRRWSRPSVSQSDSTRQSVPERRPSIPERVERRQSIPTERRQSIPAERRQSIPAERSEREVSLPLDSQSQKEDHRFQ